MNDLDSQHGTFNSLIGLYKEIGKQLALNNTNIDAINIEEEFSLTSQAITYLKELEISGACKKLELDIDYEEISNLNALQATQTCSRLTINFHSEDYDCGMFILQSRKQLFDKFSLNLARGFGLPRQFYIVEEDFNSGVDDKPDWLNSLSNALDWLDLFRNLADIDKDHKAGEQLYFLTKSEAEKYSKPFEFVIELSAEFYNITSVPEVGDFSTLKITANKKDLHIEEKRSFFKLALVEMLKELMNEKPSTPLVELAIKNIDKLKSLYFSHYEVFIHNFALHEFHQKVEEKYFEYVEKIHQAVGDIQAKIYAIPTVFLGLAALVKFDSTTSYLYIFIGISVSSLFTFWMVLDQQHRLKNIKDSMDFVFKKLKKEGNEHLEYEEVSKDISTMTGKLDDLVTSRKKRLCTYAVISWLPLQVAIMIAVSKHHQEILTFLVDIIL